MADVIRESGLSAGAVYGYFPSKESLILAAAEVTVGRITSSVQDSLHDLEPPHPGAAVAIVLRRILESLTEDGVDRTAIPLHVFGEAQRSPVLLSVLQAAHGSVRESFVEVAQRAVEQGLLQPGGPTANSPA